MAVTFADMKDGLWIVTMACSLLSPVVVALLSRTFASKTDLGVQARRLEACEDRMAKGDTRFATLESAIKVATQAAREAKTAAEETAVAAAKVHGAEVAIARLEERIKSLGEALDNIEHFTRLMVEGHMKMRA